MCRSVTLPTCGAHRPVPTNGCRSYIRFLTRDSGSFRSSQSLTEDDLWILDFWQTGYKSLHYSNVPSQRSEHHLRTQIPLPGCLKFKNTSQTNRVTPNNVPFHPVLTDVFFITPLQSRSAGREEESLIAETRYTRRHGFISPHLRTRLWLGIHSHLRVALRVSSIPYSYGNAVFECASHHNQSELHHDLSRVSDIHNPVLRERIRRHYHVVVSFTQLD